MYGTDIFIRGLIEISNICRNDCLYCGIRRSNAHCQRYRLLPGDILACAEEGYHLGFRTIVLQGGEDAYYTDDRLTDLIRELRRRWPDCAITLSLGERGLTSFQRLREAGADRYLLRHETADADHYHLLHPRDCSFEHRMQCLRDLKRCGYQVGCGFMTGSPWQTAAHLARDLLFIQQFQPEMCGIGPFIPHHDTPFARFPAGSVPFTCYLLSIVRLIVPDVLLPATTALGSLHPRGQEMGILAGANVVMPNLSPADVRSKYMLYDNKRNTGVESAQHLQLLSERMDEIGYHIVRDRGDVKHMTERRRASDRG
ncbi:MAG: [Clostridia bacterium]|nr:[FeFe] hydrogenase H-cluster radical SAM maturase HydE [Clostridia bacterium]